MFVQLNTLDQPAWSKNLATLSNHAPKVACERQRKFIGNQRCAATSYLIINGHFTPILTQKHFIC